MRLSCKNRLNWPEFIWVNNRRWLDLLLYMLVAHCTTVWLLYVEYPHIGLLPYNFMCERFDLVYCSLSVLRFVLMSILVHAHVTGSHSSYLWLGFDLRFFQFCFSSPVNMVDSYENRFAFACAFGATTTKCLSILFFGSYEEIFSPEFNEWIQSPAVPSFTGSKPTIIYYHHRHHHHHHHHQLLLHHHHHRYYYHHYHHYYY